MRRVFMRRLLVVLFVAVALLAAGTATAFAWGSSGISLGSGGAVIGGASGGASIGAGAGLVGGFGTGVSSGAGTSGKPDKDCD
jgi:hypothetical protein